MSTTSSVVSTKPAARPVASASAPASYKDKVPVVARGECGRTQRTMLEPHKLDAMRRWGHNVVCYGD